MDEPLIFCFSFILEFTLLRFSCYKKAKKELKGTIEASIDFHLPVYKKITECVLQFYVSMSFLETIADQVLDFLTTYMNT